MKAIAKLNPGPGAKLITRDVPSPKSRDILVKVRATSICGTDVHIYDWDPWAQTRIKLPRIFGHEFTGEVVRVGDKVSEIEVGDVISAETHIYCGKCFQCRGSQAHICQNLKVLGIDVDGCFAEYVSIPERCAWKVGPDVPAEMAAVLESLGGAVHATLAEEISGCAVAVFGCGPVGLFTIAIARLLEASSIFATEVNEFRLRLARRMGADMVFNPQEVDVVKEIRRATGGRGVDVFLEMSGNPTAIQQGFQVLRGGGHYVAFGLPPHSVEIDLTRDVIFKGIKLRGIFGRRIFDTWHRMAEMLRSGLDVSPVITHTFPLSEFDKAMQLVKSGNCGKVILLP